MEHVGTRIVHGHERSFGGEDGEIEPKQSWREVKKEDANVECGERKKCLRCCLRSWYGHFVAKVGRIQEGLRETVVVDSSSRVI